MGVRPRPFHRQQYRAAPFAADAHSLDEADDGQDDGAPDADLVVGRDEADGEGCQAGQQKGRDQRLLAADAIAVVAEDHRSDRAGDETDAVDGECFQHAHQRIGFRKEELAEDEGRRRAVEQEIVPFDGRAHRAGDNGATQLRAVIGFGQRMGCNADRRHSMTPGAALLDIRAVKSSTLERNSFRIGDVFALL